MPQTMQNLRTTLMPKWIYTLALAALFCDVPVIAQATLPDSKGELKDFRLDNPPPKDKPAESAPNIEAPVIEPVAKSVAPAPKPVQRAAPQQPRSTTNAPTQDATPRDVTAEDSAGTATFSDVSPPTSDIDSTPSASTPSVQAPAVPDYIQYWPWLSALLAALTGVTLLGIWKRRRAKDNDAPQAEFKAPTPIAPLLIPVAKPAVPSSMTARFDPADARLSVANLTVKGHLHLRFDGEAPLETLKLRTRVMSACDGQKALIDAFHSDPAAGQIESLGRVLPGEEIDLTLELQVPRDALQAFDWRERRFVAPIVLINVAADDGEMTPCRVSCVVGQVGEPGSSRLQPIPIDRGPKLFATLQFRPIAA